ncbi:hypothetical protein HK100_004579, partial [Physocladia obscura]
MQQIEVVWENWHWKPIPMSDNSSKETNNPSKSSAADKEQVVTPWDVQGATGADGKLEAIDYEKLIVQFGTKRIDSDLIARFERLTGVRAHPFVRRGLFFSHRYNIKFILVSKNDLFQLSISDLGLILDRFEHGKPFYLYTGRGPSSGSMHTGHMIPFLFCKYLQDVFHAPLVIQLTDDEKFLVKQDLKLEEANKFAHENAKDIVSFGFDPKLTFMFSNVDYMGSGFYKNVLKIAKCITYSQARATFGFTD